MSVHSSVIIGAILAGGKSHRMGSDKALLPVAQGTLLEWMQRKMKIVGIQHTVVCGAGPQALPDAIPDLGPLGALYTLSLHYPDRTALIIPVDMPLLEPRSLMELLAHTDVATPRHYRNYFFPLLLPLNAATANYLRGTVVQSDADRSVAACLRTLGAVAIDPARLQPPLDDDTFDNINTPEQWRNVLPRLK